MPYGVHFIINSGPNTASLANLQLSLPALHSVCNLGFVDRTVCIGIKLNLSISELGNDSNVVVVLRMG